MRIEIPTFSVVAFAGASGSGKSTFAARFFKPTEVLNSDFFRALVSDDENDQSATTAAFDCLYYTAGKRLDAGKLTVIDATNVKKSDRKKILELAKEQNCQAVAIVLDLPEKLCQERNALRSGSNKYPPYVIRNHVKALKRDLRSMRREGFRYVYVLGSPEEIESAEVVRVPLWNDKREETGPFDIIGDVHGCYDELCELLERLGYAVDKENGAAAFPERKRKAIFLGDLCDRGPENVKTLRLVMKMTESGAALCVPGNHDVKLLRWLKGEQVQLTHGLEVTVKQMEEQSLEDREKIIVFLNGLVSHYVLDGGRLVVAHAGLKEKLQGRASGRVRAFCLYGETTGETDEFGLPVQTAWAEDYRGKALVVYGHIPSEEARTVNDTFCVDTGCVFGGKLTALRYTERELFHVPARREYYAPIKPLPNAAAKIPDEHEQRGDRLNVKDVLGKRHIVTRLYRGITVEEANSATALEVMSRFAADPRWLIYLPPTMAPCETSKLEGYLEHPLEALGYFKSNGVERVVCEQKHMGSRAVIVLCRNTETARRRFEIDDISGTASPGLIYTRTGRHFFGGADAKKEGEILSRLSAVLDKTGFWKDFGTDWVCLDTELMPWSAKARELLTEQYAPVSRAGLSGLAESIAALKRGAARQNRSAANVAVNKKTSGQNIALDDVLEKYKLRRENLERYAEAWHRYCWPTPSVDDYRVAPFHILATEGRVWNDVNHLNHMEAIARYMTGHDPLFTATAHLAADLTDEKSSGAAVDWWTDLTASGGEGMVIKPLDFIAHRKGREDALLQPAVKCRGREYLRIIYGPEYTDAHRLERLKKRSLGRKRRLALAEFALGMESLERFVNREPLYRVHECVFAVLAMESEPIDPRL
ncbi:MAG: polynucleotide kinase-phosphatase [Synergistaceae bacterium]|jgi:protein phosphatase|nr:polynucleotide kinase-phosphatase [Synergistaceae bacterium]